MKIRTLRSLMPGAAALRCALVTALVLSGSSVVAKSARENWDSLCAQCHGSDGNGKTKEGTKRHIKDWTDPKIQASFTDSGLLKNLMLGVSTEGGAERMPRFDGKLAVPEAKELIALIRSFKRQGP